MKVTHEFSLTRKCPVNDSRNEYTVTVETTGLLAVEAILKAADALPDKLYQEDITQRLADATGARVTTAGTHSGVMTTATAEPEVRP